MAAPNMATITASIERSLQNCSLNNHHQSSSSSSSSSNSTGSMPARFASGRSSTSSDSPDNLHISNSNSLELNSEIPLPYYWEQCLDLKVPRETRMLVEFKTGEVYFINWRTGMKSQEDPRTNPEINGDYYSDDDTSYDCQGSSSESSPSSSREQCHQYNTPESNDRAPVLVVAGCKSCLMYFMVPKQVEDCPKCYGQLLHFDRSENGSP